MIFDKTAYLYNQEDHKEMIVNKYIERYSLYKFLPELKDLEILELGTSTGIIAKHMIAQGAKSVLGIDASEEMIKYALKRNEEKFTGMVHDLNQPLDIDRKFDLIVSSLTLHYVEDWSAILSTLKNNLKFGGKFILQIENSALDKVQNDELEHNDLIMDTWSKDGQEFLIDMYYKDLSKVVEDIESTGLVLIRDEGSSSLDEGISPNKNNFVLLEFGMEL